MGDNFDELKARLDAVEATFVASIIERDSLHEKITELEARNVELTADFHRVQSELDAAEQQQHAAKRAARKLATMYHRGECSRRSEVDDLISAFDAWLPSQPVGNGG